MALAYEDHHIRYLAGLKTQKKVLRELLLAVPEAQFYAHPLTDERGPEGYWGIPCVVPFQHIAGAGQVRREAREQPHRPPTLTTETLSGFGLPFIGQGMVCLSYVARLALLSIRFERCEK